MVICIIQYFEADFLWKVSLKILISRIILKTFTHATVGSGGIERLDKARGWKSMGNSMCAEEGVRGDRDR